MKPLFPVFLILISGCESSTNSPPPPPDRDLKSVEIADIELTAESFDLNQGLVPEGYENSGRITVKVKKADGTIETIANPIMNQFAFTAKHLTVSTQADHTLTLFSDENSFDYRNEKFELGVSIEGNTFPEKTFTFGIYWAGLKSLSFSGLSEAKGHDLLIHTAHIKDTNGDYRAYHVNDLTSEKRKLVVVPATQSLTFYADGGTGNPGLSGKNGTSYGSCDENGQGYAGGNGENGGNGGDGGDAGNVIVKYVTPSDLNHIAVSTIGGSGGLGGPGGNGGSGCWSGFDGKIGYSGSNGKSTQTVYQKVPASDVLLIFSDGHDFMGVQFIE